MYAIASRVKFPRTTFQIKHGEAAQLLSYKVEPRYKGVRYNKNLFYHKLIFMVPRSSFYQGSTVLRTVINRIDSLDISFLPISVGLDPICAFLVTIYVGARETCLSWCEEMKLFVMLIVWSIWLESGLLWNLLGM